MICPICSQAIHEGRMMKSKVSFDRPIRADVFVCAYHRKEPNFIQNYTELLYNYIVECGKKGKKINE
jgi:hypothetical protein